MKRPAIGLAGLLAALMLLPVAGASAAPVAPDIIVSDVENQGGLLTEAAGWFTLTVENGGSATYTQVALTVKSTNPTLHVVGAYDANSGNPVDSSICTEDFGTDTSTCIFPNSVPGFGATPPIKFVFHGTEITSQFCLDNPGDPSCSNVTATVSMKDNTNTGGGGSGNDRVDVANQLLQVRIEDKTEFRTALVPANTSLSLTTYKGKPSANGLTQRSQLSLPAAPGGYFASFEELGLAGGALPELPGCEPTSEYVSFPADASVNQGGRIYPFLEWTLSMSWPTASAPTSFQPTATHCLSNPDYDSSQPVSATNLPYSGFELITVICPKNSLAGSQKDQSCIVSGKKTTSGKNGSITTYTLKVRTAGNGALRYK